MKARRILEHRQLVIEVVKFCQEKFNPDVKMIKTRVEALIEKEFLKRDAVQIGIILFTLIAIPYGRKIAMMIIRNSKKI